MVAPVPSVPSDTLFVAVRSSHNNFFDTAPPKDNIVSSSKKYVVPARRHVICHTGKERPFIFTEEIPTQIAPSDEVEPKFRTPCRYIMVGAIKLQV